jgi:hypothetical protein
VIRCLNTKHTSIFECYDYGALKNWHKYGQATPPNYDLKKAKAPLVHIGGQNDLFTSANNTQINFTVKVGLAGNRIKRLIDRVVEGLKLQVTDNFKTLCIY